MSRLERTNCEEAFRLLDDFLDRQLSDDEVRIIQEHLEICAWCTREFNFEASMLHGLKRKLRQIEAPPELLSRVLSQLPPTDEPV